MLRNDRQLILADFLNEDECSLPRPMRFSAAAGKFRICLYISIHFPPIGHLSAEKMRKTRLRILEKEGMEGRGREQRKKDGKERAPYRQRRGKLKGTGGSCVPGMPLSETKKSPRGLFPSPWGCAFRLPPRTPQNGDSRQPCPASGPVFFSILFAAFFAAKNSPKKAAPKIKIPPTTWPHVNISFKTRADIATAETGSK